MGLNGYDNARAEESSKTLNGVVASVAYFRSTNATFG